MLNVGKTVRFRKCHPNCECLRIGLHNKLFHVKMVFQATPMRPLYLIEEIPKSSLTLHDEDSFDDLDQFYIFESDHVEVI